MISIVKAFDAEINTLFFTAVNFDLRSQWREDIKEIGGLNHVLPQVGTKHHCVLENGQMIMYTSNYSYQSDKIVYGETDDKKEKAAYMTFEKTDENKTRMTLDIYMKKNFIAQTLFQLFAKKKLETLFTKSLENLSNVVKDVKLPVEV